MAWRQRVVVVGAGFGGIALARALRHQRIDVLLIDRNNHHVFHQSRRSALDHRTTRSVDGLAFATEAPLKITQQSSPRINPGLRSVAVAPTGPGGGSLARYRVGP